MTRLGPRQPRLVVPLGAVELDAVDDRAPLQRRDALKVRVQLLLEEKVLVARVLPHLRQFLLQARVRGALPLRLRRGFRQSLLGVGVAGLHARARHGQDAGLVLGRDLGALGRVDFVFLAHCCVLLPLMGADAASARGRWAQATTGTASPRRAVGLPARWAAQLLCLAPLWLSTAKLSQPCKCARTPRH